MNIFTAVMDEATEKMTHMGHFSCSRTCIFCLLPAQPQGLYVSPNSMYEVNSAFSVYLSYMCILEIENA